MVSSDPGVAHNPAMESVRDGQPEIATRIVTGLILRFIQIVANL